MRRRAVLPAALAIVAAACAGGDDPSPGQPDDGPDGGADDEIVGELGGDPELAGGCSWVEVDGTRYEIVWPDGWEVDEDAGEARSPDGDDADFGDTVAVTGTVDDDAATICQVGPVLEAEQVRLVD